MKNKLSNNPILLTFIALHVIFFTLSIVDYFIGGNFCENMRFLAYYNVPYLMPTEKLHLSPYLELTLFTPQISFIFLFILSTFSKTNKRTTKILGVTFLILYSIIFTLIYLLLFTRHG